jgi:hypothetical protein
VVGFRIKQRAMKLITRFKVAFRPKCELHALRHEAFHAVARSTCASAERRKALDVEPSRCQDCAADGVVVTVR